MYMCIHIHMHPDPSHRQASAASVKPQTFCKCFILTDHAGAPYIVQSYLYSSSTAFLMYMLSQLNLSGFVKEDVLQCIRQKHAIPGGRSEEGEGDQ